VIYIYSVLNGIILYLSIILRSHVVNINVKRFYVTNLQYLYLIKDRLWYYYINCWLIKIIKKIYNLSFPSSWYQNAPLWTIHTHHHTHQAFCIIILLPIICIYNTQYTWIDWNLNILLTYNFYIRNKQFVQFKHSTFLQE